MVILWESHKTNLQNAVYVRSKNNVQAAKVLADIIKSPESAKDYIKQDEVTIARRTEGKALVYLLKINILLIEAMPRKNCTLYFSNESVIKA